MNERDLAKQKGISGITIIILLILAGVSITTLTGDEGLISQANNAKLQTEIPRGYQKNCKWR